MNPDSERHQRLEHAVHRALTQLPARRAPAGLEQRVLTEIQRRAALPWWRKSFVHWPLAARAVFLVGCIGVVKLVIMASVWVMAGFDPVQYREAFATPVAFLDGVNSALVALRGALDLALRHIPAPWLYAAGAFFAIMYAALFGLGAAAYKALFATR